jgi:hypothetical protein
MRLHFLSPHSGERKEQKRAKTSFSGNRRDLGNKPGAALECDVAPQPGDRDNEAIPQPNQKIDVHRAPKDPTNKTPELKVTELNDGGAPTDGRQISQMPITKRRP